MKSHLKLRQVLGVSIKLGEFICLSPCYRPLTPQVLNITLYIEGGTNSGNNDNNDTKYQASPICPTQIHHLFFALSHSLAHLFIIDIVVGVSRYFAATLNAITFTDTMSHTQRHSISNSFYRHSINSFSIFSLLVTIKHINQINGKHREKKRATHTHSHIPTHAHTHTNIYTRLSAVHVVTCK